METTFAFRPIGFAKRDLASFEIIATTVRERRELEFHHQKLEAETFQRRRVQPLSLVCVENQWYLRAYDRIRSNLRTFHLGPIRNPKLLTQRFERPFGFDVTESFVNSNADGRGHRHKWLCRPPVVHPGRAFTTDQCLGKFGLSRDMTSKKVSITVSAMNISMASVLIGLAGHLYNEAASHFRTQHSLSLPPAQKPSQWSQTALHTNRE